VYVLPSPHERFVHLGGELVEGEVPEPGVERRGEEQRGRGRHAREGGLGDDQALQPVPVIGGQGVGDRHPDVSPVHREPLMAERRHEGGQVVGKGPGVVAVLGLVGEPDAALVDRDDLEVAGQGRHEQAPGVPGLGPAVDQQQRRPLAPDDGVQAQLTGIDEAAGEGVGESFRQVRRPGNGAGALRRGSCAHEDLPSQHAAAGPPRRGVPRQVWFASAGVRIRQWPARLASQGPQRADRSAELRLERPGGGRVAGKDAVELTAGADGQLGEDLAQVVLDRARADGQPGADLRIRQPRAG
jgi:hypothetical protein